MKQLEAKESDDQRTEKCLEQNDKSLSPAKQTERRYEEGRARHIDQLQEPRVMESQKLESTNIRTLSSDVDSAAINYISKKYGVEISSERIEAMRRLPTKFESSEAFARNYEEAIGKRPEAGVAGWSRGLDESAHVSTKEIADVPEIVMHERIHQAVNSESDARVSREMVEGYVESLTQQATGHRPEPGEPAAYPDEVARVEQIASKVGWEALDRFFLAGDDTLLRQRLEHHLAGQERRSEALASMPDISRHV